MQVCPIVPVQPPPPNYLAAEAKASLAAIPARPGISKEVSHASSGDDRRPIPHVHVLEPKKAWRTKSIGEERHFVPAPLRMRMVPQSSNAEEQRIVAAQRRHHVEKVTLASLVALKPACGRAVDVARVSLEESDGSPTLPKGASSSTDSREMPAATAQTGLNPKVHGETAWPVETTAVQEEHLTESSWADGTSSDHGFSNGSTRSGSGDGAPFCGAQEGSANPKKGRLAIRKMHSSDIESAATRGWQLEWGRYFGAHQQHDQHRR